MNGILKFILGIAVAKVVYNSAYPKKGFPERRIFISHSWEKGSKDYILLKQKLQNQNIKVYDHSIPIHKAFDESKKKELEKIFRKQMVYCSKVFVLANRGLKENTFVMTEIKIAKEMKKEVIAVKPYGQKGIPNFIKKNADIIISNNIESIKKVLI